MERLSLDPKWDSCQRSVQRHLRVTLFPKEPTTNPSHRTRLPPCPVCASHSKPLSSTLPQRNRHSILGHPTCPPAMTLPPLWAAQMSETLSNGEFCGVSAEWLMLASDALSPLLPHRAWSSFGGLAGCGISHHVMDSVAVTPL